MEAKETEESEGADLFLKDDPTRGLFLLKGRQIFAPAKKSVKPVVKPP